MDSSELPQFAWIADCETVARYVKEFYRVKESETK